MYYRSFNFYWQDNQGNSGFIEGHDCLWEIEDWVRVGDFVYEVVSTGILNNLPVFALVFLGELDDQVD